MAKGLLILSKKTNYFFFFFLLFSYASGGEDGLVRVHYFDNDYLDFDF